MAKREIIWSNTAEESLKDILDFYIERNKSINYALKLLSLFSETVSRLSEVPEMGLKCKNIEIKIFILKHYLIVYEYDEHTLRILNIWDSRQDPDKAPFERM